ncbi:MAG TPA: S53 family peptidase [Bryobacteraceae bacterium]|nr:S53 family peptidase [Bryobacteraceae bacterium]
MAGAAVSRPVHENEIISATVVLRRRTQLEPAERFAFSHAHAAHRHTREELGVLHGAHPAEIAAIESFAHEYGLTVTASSQARRSVVLSGPAVNMQQAFGVTLHHYTSPRGEYRGRTGPVMLPAEIHPMVTAVLGLDSRPIAKPHVRLRPATHLPGTFTPAQVGRLYNFPASGDGAGQTIGIIELGGGYRTSDLNTYFKSLGLKAPKVKSVSVDGGLNQPGKDQDSDGEVMLDIEVAGAVASGANIVVYFAPNTDQGFVDAITTAVHDTANKPSVISISWGGPEDSWTQQAADAMLQAVTDAAAVGVTITAAAGDNGSDDGVGDGKLHVDLPACLPPVLGCGGTRLIANATAISSEVVWNETASNEGATGGGVSKLYARPSYQASANVPVQPETNFAGRGVPDVSGDADPVTGYQVRVDGKNMVIGGTSAVAPLWAGLIALMNQHLGRPVGFLNPAIYQIGESVFRDISNGNNGYWSAKSGWDACTGLGSPNGAALLSALSGQASQAETV